MPTIETNANSLLTNVFAKAPKATVYVASMIGFPHCPVCSQAFNKLVPGIVTPNDDSRDTRFLQACLTLPTRNTLFLPGDLPVLPAGMRA